MKRFLALSIALLLSGCFEYSDGERVGTITKFSKKGWFCKTWEGEMYLGGLKKKTTSNGESTTTSMVANTWDFTVEDERLVPAIQKAMAAGDPVTLHYKEEMVSFCRSDGGNYFVTAVK